MTFSCIMRYILVLSSSYILCIVSFCVLGDGKCVICDSYVKPCTLVRICDECNYGSYQGRCVICGNPGVSDAYYCKECTMLEKDVRYEIDSYPLTRLVIEFSFSGISFWYDIILWYILCVSMHAWFIFILCHSSIHQRDGCPKIVNLGSAKTDLFYERKKYGFKVCIIIVWRNDSYGESNIMLCYNIYWIVVFSYVRNALTYIIIYLAAL